MKSTVFIIHGSFGSPFENWFPGSYTQLSKLGITTFVPHFPTPEGQTFGIWSNILNGYAKAELLNENSILICHSSACAFVLKYALNNSIKFKGVLTVAGFNNFQSGNADFDKINSEFFLSNEDLILSSKQFSLIHSFFSESDPNLPLEVLEDFADSIKAIKHIVAGGGHFNLQAGYSKFPELINLILSF